MGNIKLYLKPNERLFINGAVVKADRKVGLELVNEAVFLLENHVLQHEDATTPLRQLYYVVQLLLMQPSEPDEPIKIYGEFRNNLLQTLTESSLLAGIKAADVEVLSGRYFAALKIIRALFVIEDEILACETGNQLGGHAGGAAEDAGSVEEVVS